MTATLFGPENVIDTNEASDILIVMADLDGDGDLDQVGGDDGVFWYENNGFGQFGFEQEIADAVVGFNVRDIDVGDIDGDGDLDVVASSISNSRVQWWANDGSGGFGTSQVITDQSSVGASVALADFDDDGDLDVIADGDGVDRYRNDGFGGFSTAGNFVFATSYLDVADFNGDAVMDVLAADATDDSITLLTGTTSGIVLINDPGNLIAADLDGDGDQDIVATSQADGELLWYENTSPTGNLLAGIPLITTIDSSLPGAFDVQAGDLDGDGDLDLLAAGSSGDTVAWYENDGATAPSFTRHTLTTSAQGVENVAIADIDGDGNLDVSYVSAGDNRRVWRRNLEPTVVNDTADTDDGDILNGTTTLREAIGRANQVRGVNLITFSSLFDSPQTILLDSQLPTITDDLTITGPGAELLTLDAGDGDDNTFATGDGFRIFRINDGEFGEIEVTLSSMRLTGGDTANGATGMTGYDGLRNGPGGPGGRGGDGVDGGVIWSTENLTIVDAILSGNATGDGGRGGTGGNAGPTAFTFDAGPGGPGGDGGNGAAIWSNASLTVLNSTISGNRAGAGGAGGFGGNGSLASESADGDGGSGGTGGFGGAIFSTGVVTITESVIDDNRAGNGGGGTPAGVFGNRGGSGGSGGKGGGLFLDGPPASVVRTTIENNRSGVGSSGSTGTRNGNGGNGGTGGGIHSNVSLTIRDSLIADNQTGRGNRPGNGIPILSESGGDGGNGGGIYATASLAIINSTISGNLTGSGGSGGFSAAGDGGDGAGIFASDDLSVEVSTITDNRTRAGGSRTNGANGSGGAGGGILVSNANATRILEIHNSIIAENTAEGNAPDLIFASGGPLDFRYNLVGDREGSTLIESQTPDANGNLIGDSGGLGSINPGLDSLADNGGPTRTHALLPVSPAINSGDPSFDPNAFSPLLITDQRGDGFDRVESGRVDRGSFETLESPPVLNSFTRYLPLTSVTSADTLIFRATFDEEVSNVDENDFAVGGDSSSIITGVAAVQGTGEVIYEITVSGGDLGDFNGLVGLDLSPTQDITDLFGKALPSTEPAVDETYLVDNVAPQVEGVTINDGSNSRSQVTSVSVVFDQEVDHTLLQTAFALTNIDNDTPVGSIAIAATDSGGKTTAVLTFSGSSTFDRLGTGVLGDSLADGNYRLDIAAAQIVRSDTSTAMAADYIFGGQTAGQPNNDNFFRHYGDANGDGFTNFTDFASGFLPAFATSQGDAGFRADLDNNGDGSDNFTDFAEGFLPNFATGRQ